VADASFFSFAEYPVASGGELYFAPVQPARFSGSIVDAVDVYVGGSSGPSPKPAVKSWKMCPARIIHEASAASVNTRL
jgi:hypothetical protein